MLEAISIYLLSYRFKSRNNVLTALPEFIYGVHNQTLLYTHKMNVRSKQYLSLSYQNSGECNTFLENFSHTRIAVRVHMSLTIFSYTAKPASHDPMYL